jgi:ubiquinone/menaquinone biosynthesis C-methylase UbiE
MKRELTNKIRFVLEELLPPIVHDSRLMVFLYRLKWGNFIDELAEFRRKAPFLTAEEYRSVYERMPRVQENSDNSELCIKRILSEIEGPRVCDIGCGTGFLLRKIDKNCSHVTSLTGVDFVLEKTTQDLPKVNFVEAPIENLPFKDGEFDTVICTHVLEHILDISKAISELRRICSKRLIIIVPMEREHLYTFNPHFHFFPFTHSFLRIIRPNPDSFTIENIQRDIFYVENQNHSD